MYLLEDTQSRIGVIGKFGISAPIAVVVVEELVAMGVKRFVSIEVAGSLQRDLHIGDIMVCKRAIRDEGTSYHYFKPSKYAYASKVMTRRNEESLTRRRQKYAVGTTWNDRRALQENSCGTKALSKTRSCDR
jgi:uridine phosphorylase